MIMIQKDSLIVQIKWSFIVYEEEKMRAYHRNRLLELEPGALPATTVPSVVVLNHKRVQGTPSSRKISEKIEVE